MVLTLWVLGHNLITISTENGTETEQVTRSIGFAAAELAETYLEAPGSCSVHNRRSEAR